MCVRVRIGEDIDTPRWNRDHITIDIPAVGRAHALDIARDILTALGVPQRGPGARCWCRAPVHIPATCPESTRVPQQRNILMEVPRGA